mgnify:CR=1 FL=1
MTRSSGETRLGPYLASRRELVEGALDRLMPPASTRPERLHSAMRYSVFSGGKRLRPILVLASCELVGGRLDAGMTTAVATELIHTYSLIHDDLPSMDDDATRRGRPTCHVEFDEATAILAGDGLLTLAFELIANEVGLGTDRRVKIIAELASANGAEGMVGGQVADMEAEGAAPDLELVRFIHTNKTGKPLRAAVLSGALAAGAAEDDLRSLDVYGSSVGLAFQIADDLLDLTGTQEEMGKAVGKDDSRGKATYPRAAGVEGARDRAAELMRDAVDALEPFGDAAWALREIARFIVDRKS